MTFKIQINDNLKDAIFGFTVRNISGVVCWKNDNLGSLKKDQLFWLGFALIVF